MFHSSSRHKPSTPSAASPAPLSCHSSGGSLYQAKPTKPKASGAPGLPAIPEGKRGDHVVPLSQGPTTLNFVPFDPSQTGVGEWSQFPTMDYFQNQQQLLDLASESTTTIENVEATSIADLQKIATEIADMESDMRDQIDCAAELNQREASLRDALVGVKRDQKKLDAKNAKFMTKHNELKECREALDMKRQAAKWLCFASEKKPAATMNMNAVRALVNLSTADDWDKLTTRANTKKRFRLFHLGYEENPQYPTSKGPVKVRQKHGENSEDYKASLQDLLYWRRPQPAAGAVLLDREEEEAPNAALSLHEESRRLLKRLGDINESEQKRKRTER